MSTLNTIIYQSYLQIIYNRIYQKRATIIYNAKLLAEVFGYIGATWAGLKSKGGTEAYFEQ